jgi:hypothetical protein
MTYHVTLEIRHSNGHTSCAIVRVEALSPAFARLHAMLNWIDAHLNAHIDGMLVLGVTQED